jgi:uncharacterized membrane protein YjjB (DUF3815 family)
MRYDISNSQRVVLNVLFLITLVVGLTSCAALLVGMLTVDQHLVTNATFGIAFAALANGFRGWILERGIAGFIVCLFALGVGITRTLWHL